MMGRGLQPTTERFLLLCGLGQGNLAAARAELEAFCDLGPSETNDFFASLAAPDPNLVRG